VTLPAAIIALALYYKAVLFLAEDWFAIDLPDVGLFVALVAALWISRPSRALALRRTILRPGMRGWILLVAWGAISLSWSSNTDYGAIKLASLFCFGILPGAIAANFGGLTARTRFWPVLLGGLLYSSVVLIYGDLREERLTFNGANPIWIARSCLVAASLAIWVRRIPLVVRLATVAVCIGSALLTGSRGPLVSFLCAPLAVLFVSSFRRSASAGARPIHRITALVFATVALTTGLVTYSNASASSPLARILTVLQPRESITQDEAVAGRLSLQTIAWNNFEAHPLVGVGAGGNAPRGAVAYPHNVFLEAASELGLVGLVILCCIVARALWRARDDRLLLTLCFQAVFYASLSGDLGSNDLLVVFMCLTSCSAITLRSHADHGDETPYPAVA
jgi:O-antigen ligase